MKNKLVCIIPYFGNWPTWFDAYLYTASNQAELVEFLFYTDCPIPTNSYANIRFNAISYNDYCEYVSKKLSCNFRPKTAYKLCDLKPFYGFIHREDIDQYKYWGFGDIDLIYGDLVKYIRPIMDNDVDICSTHCDRVSGHFCMLRNTEKMRSLAFKIPKYKEILESEMHYGLDEGGFSQVIFGPIFRFLLKLYRRVFFYSGFEKFSTLLQHLIFSYKLCFRDIKTTPWGNQIINDVYQYDDNKIINEDTKYEIPYLHFLFYKKNKFTKEYVWDENTNFHINLNKPFLITKDGFIQ